MATNGGVLAIIAHPDDETLVSGALAAAANRGEPVTVVCATRGEVGQIAEGSGATAETLGEFRERELREAMRIAGVEDVRFLGYRDSGMAGTPENDDPRAFWWASPEEVTPRLIEIIRELRPSAVLTWDPTGGYGHPDHIAIHGHATAAFHVARQDDGAPVSALFYTLIPVEEFRAAMEELRAAGVEIEGPGDPDAIPEEPPLAANCVIDVGRQYERKLEALQQHKTQAQDFGQFMAMPPETLRRMFSRELYYRAWPAVADGVVLDKLRVR